METNLEMQLADERKLAVQPSPAELIHAVIEKGLTLDSVGVVERLVALAERQEARQAEKEFNSAFADLQAEMKNVRASKAVPNKDGSVRYYFAPYDEIWKQVQPFLTARGFAVSYTMDFKEGRVIQTCYLRHKGGHCQTNQAMARVGNGPPGSSEAQGDGAASTYAKRFALIGALNIVSEVDTDGKDARNEGAPITWEQGQMLRELLKETGSDEKKFLALAGAPTIDEIGSAKFDLCLAALGRKRKS